MIGMYSGVGLGAGADPLKDFEGPFDSFYCLFHVRRFLTQLFAIGNVNV